MTITEKFFVEIISAGIKGNTVNGIPDGLDYKKLYSLCARNSMAVVAFNALQKVKTELSEQFVYALENNAFHHVRRDIQSEHDVGVVLSAFEENGVKYMPLKGYHLKKLYPSTDMRYTADCDVLIDVCELETVRDIMKKLGLSVKGFDEHHDVFVAPQTGTLFELHKTIFVGSLENYFGKGNEGFIKARLKEGYNYFYEFDKEIFYVSILAHSAYHFSSGAGVGIRHLTDIYLYRKNVELNEEYLNEELSKCGLLTFKNKFEQLAYYLFENGEADEFIYKLASHVLSSSLHENKENISAVNVAKNAEDGNLKTAKNKTKFRKIFPEKEKMQFSYPVLKKHLYLLPLFYVVRWFEVLFKRPNNVKKLKQTSEVTMQEVASMGDILTGLDIKKL